MAHETRRLRALSVAAAALAIGFAALLWPASADAQTRPLRDKCIGPAWALNVQPSVPGAAFSAAEPLLGCASGAPGTSFRVMKTCTYHCQHWHTWVPTGTPAIANVRLSAVAAPASAPFLVRWSDDCTPRLGQPRSDCTVRVASNPTNVQATFSPTPDVSAPSAPAAFVAGAPASFSVTVGWTASADDFAVAGYDVVRHDTGAVIARAGRAATSVKAASLRCETDYTLRVDAFDASQNAASSAPFAVRTGKCTPKPPNTILHVGPSKRTKSRSAYFHWGANRTPVTYQCKLDKGRWTSCRPGKRYRNLKKGAHTFQVRAKDAGGFDPTPAKRTWRIV